MMFKNGQRMICCVVGWLALASTSAPAESLQDVSRQIAELMSQGASGKAHERYAHAKGIVCQGTFQASPGANAISRAPHLQVASVKITVRFSSEDRKFGGGPCDPMASKVLIRMVGPVGLEPTTDGL
jgi:hypothetical protein